jgi:hypothetical protein
VQVNGRIRMAAKDKGGKDKGSGGGGEGPSSPQKGPSGKESIKRYLEKRWDKATFGSVEKSIEYHVTKHGQGLSPVEYTQRAMKAFEDPSALRVATTDIQMRPALKVVSDTWGSGLYTKGGKIIWFHPKL